MADFKTHLTVASMSSGLICTYFMTMNVPNAYKSKNEVILYFILGIIGGILPDIDSEKSVPTSLFFNFLGPFCAFFVVFSHDKYSFIELIIIWMLIFVGIKYVLLYLFTYLTSHRGIVHSVPMGILCWFLTSTILDRLFKLNNLASWLGGFFLFLGFLTHLILDELYSIDFVNFKLKQSFGTALKLGNFNSSSLFGYGIDKITVIIYVVILGLFFVMPKSDLFRSFIFNKNNYLQIKFLPKDNNWFNDFFKKRD